MIPIHIGIDDTDSVSGMCTTYLASELILEFNECDVIGYPRLVRLNPNIPWKTRGNGAICLRFGKGVGESRPVCKIGDRTYGFYADGNGSQVAQEFEERVAKIVESHYMLDDDNSFLKKQLMDLSASEIIGADSGLADVMQMVRQVARFDSPVMLLGETGVGKGLVANAIHQASLRKHGPFVSVNCGAIPDSLLDSELFGHEKGSFTGAISQKRGRFERADKGTIFLDEIGDLPFNMQVKLLRFLDENKIEKVGGNRPFPLDVRIIAATNRNLMQEVVKESFRLDLYYRLSVLLIRIPPLVERKEDIPLHDVYGPLYYIFQFPYISRPVMLI